MSSLPNCKKPCAQCPFRKDTIKGWLGKRAIEEIIKSDTFVCHKKRHLQCAGHMLINGERNTFVQIANRLNFPLGLSGRELIFDTREECIAHHSGERERRHA